MGARGETLVPNQVICTEEILLKKLTKNENYIQSSYFSFPLCSTCTPHCKPLKTTLVVSKAFEI